MSSLGDTGRGELLCPVCVLVVQESAHDWQVPGESVSYRRGGELQCPVSVVLGGELLCPARVIAVQESAHDWQLPGESMWYREEELLCPISVVQGGRATMFLLCDTGL